MTHHRHPRSLTVSRRGQKGVAMLEGLISMTILAFGMLALTKMQTGMVAQGHESNTRTIATSMADELLTMAMTDPANAACYTVPATGTCGSTTASSQTTAWRTRALATVPGSPTVSSVLSSNRLTVVIGWTGKESQSSHSVTVVTDVRT